MPGNIYVQCCSTIRATNKHGMNKHGQSADTEDDAELRRARTYVTTATATEQPAVYERRSVCYMLSHTHTPLGRFSKLDCSKNNVVPVPSDTYYVFGKLSARSFQRRPFWHRDTVPTSLWRHRAAWTIAPQGEGWYTPCSIR